MDDANGREAAGQTARRRIASRKRAGGTPALHARTQRSVELIAALLLTSLRQSRYINRVAANP